MQHVSSEREMERVEGRAERGEGGEERREGRGARGKRERDKENKGKHTNNEESFPPAFRETHGLEARKQDK